MLWSLNLSLRTHLITLFATALLLRLIVFFGYLQHEERYKQPDTMDYHNCALGIVHGTGMHRADSQEPIFWRTPGYPLYLSIFYSWYGWSARFSASFKAHRAALIGQIIISALVPLLVFACSSIIVPFLPHVAWISAWITVFHTGFVLASGFLLTEALAIFFFLLFLCFFFKGFFRNDLHVFFLLAALCLGAFTWIRPMGEFLSVLITFLIIGAQARWTKNIIHATTFLGLFALTLAPWYMRNYTLTGHWFFCPMLGPYLNSFCAPKIVRTVKQIPLEKAISILYHLASETFQKMQAHVNRGSYICRELICLSVAWPFVSHYPWLFIYDWIKEVLKTTFDLYAYQLVALTHNTFMYDPLEEFLSVKVAACLWQGSLPIYIRLLSWIEAIYACALWAGVFIGIWYFIVVPLIHQLRVAEFNSLMFSRSLLMLIIIGAAVGMTGGFGYARLRLPIEPLLIILSLSTWVGLWSSKIKLFKLKKTMVSY